jgi:hypothetical protein
MRCDRDYIQEQLQNIRCQNDVALERFRTLMALPLASLFLRYSGTAWSSGSEPVEGMPDGL